MTNSHYNLLGVSEGASLEEIKKSFRKLSLKLHPDRNGNSDASNKIFQELNEAYEILSDEQKRKEYDFQRKNPFLNNNGNNPNDILNMFFSGMDGNIFGGGPPPFGGVGGPFGNGGPAFKVFHNGMHPNQQYRQKPQPIVKTTCITLEQAYQGCNIPIEIERVLQDGGARRLEREMIYVPIPKGIDNKEILFLKDRGNVSQSGVRGDVKIVIKLINNTHFKRDGLDLLYKKKYYTQRGFMWI